MSLFILALFMCVLLVYGVISIFSPITLIKLLARWPKIVAPRFFGEAAFSSRVHNRLWLLENNPDEYRRRYGRTLLMMRIMGVIALLMFLIILVSICALMSGYISPNGV
jgi:hypothetical protein